MDPFKYFPLVSQCCVCFSSSTVPVGRIGFPSGSLSENVLEAMKGVVRYVPRGWKNIQAVHIKSVSSISLPVYNSLPLAPSKVVVRIPGRRPAKVGFLFYVYLNFSRKEGCGRHCVST